MDTKHIPIYKINCSCNSKQYAKILVNQFLSCFDISYPDMRWFCSGEHSSYSTNLFSSFTGFSIHLSSLTVTSGIQYMHINLIHENLSNLYANCLHFWSSYCLATTDSHRHKAGFFTFLIIGYWWSQDTDVTRKQK